VPEETTTQAPSSEPANSGEQMPVGDIPGWRQIFADDFQTNVPLGSFPSAVSSAWGCYDDGWHDTSGNGTYNCTKVCSVHDGALDLYIHTQDGVHYVAVPYPKIPGGSSQNGQLYGRYAVRFKADLLHGYKTAWLLWPDSGVWPRDGEIDFPEGELSGTMNAFMHHKGATLGSEQDAYPTGITYGTWHTAIIEWSPSAVSYYLDGKLIGQSTKYIPDTPMHWVLQTETSTAPGVIPSDSTEGHVLIAWVAVYALAL
jgi:beta-glucanase (GH16 family)